MSIGNSNVMHSSSSSSSCSSSLATKVGDLIKQLDEEKKISSCVIGISTLAFHFLSKNIAHTALFVLTHLGNLKKIFVMSDILP